MKLIKFIRKPEREGARIIYIPACAEKISQLAVIDGHTNKHGFEVPTLYFIDTYGLGTIELSEDQFNRLVNFLIDKDFDGDVLEINEYNTDMSQYEPAKVEEAKEEVKPQLQVVNDNEVNNETVN